MGRELTITWSVRADSDPIQSYVQSTFEQAWWQKPSCPSRTKEANQGTERTAFLPKINSINSLWLVFTYYTETHFWVLNWHLKLLIMKQKVELAIDIFLAEFPHKYKMQKHICGHMSYTLFLSSYNIRMLKAGRKTEKAHLGQRRPSKTSLHCQNRTWTSQQSKFGNKTRCGLWGARGGKVYWNQLPSMKQSRTLLKPSFRSRTSPYLLLSIQ